MYYAFDNTGKCVCSGDSEFTLENMTILESENHYNIFDIILVNGSIQEKQTKDSTKKLTIIDAVDNYTDLQVDLMETMAEMNEVILLSAGSGESEE